MTTRREELIERKNTILSSMRGGVVASAEPQDRPALFTMVDAFGLLVDVLIDMAHPER